MVVVEVARDAGNRVVELLGTEMGGAAGVEVANNLYDTIGDENTVVAQEPFTRKWMIRTAWPLLLAS